MVKWKFKLPFIGGGAEYEKHQIILKKGDSILLQTWSWRKPFGYKRKIVTIDDNGDVKVTKI